MSLAERLHFDPIARVLPFVSALAIFAAVARLPATRARQHFLLLAATSPFLLIYAAEARAYALLSLLILVLFLLVARGAETFKRLAGVFFLSVAALYLHYLALFAVAGVFVVAVHARRWRTGACVIAGSLCFLPWTPILSAQPAAAMAWVRESHASTLAGFLAALGGTGRFVPSLGGPLPLPLLVLGGMVGLTLLASLARPARSDPEVRRALLLVLSVLAGIWLASWFRPVAFPGRSEMAVLPVWLWAVSRAGAETRPVRWAIGGAFALGAASSLWLLLAVARTPVSASRLVSALSRVARETDRIVAGADFYLPARLARDRGQLSGNLEAWPSRLADHPGWFRPEPPALDELEGLRRQLQGAPAGQKFYFLLRPWQRTPRLLEIFQTEGSTREIPHSPEGTILVWTGPSRRTIARSDMP